EEDRDLLIAKAVFYRARAYYRLTHQFGDVPLILEEVVTPRIDFYTYERESILRKMKEDMDQYVTALPLTAPLGTVNRDAAYHLLTKINLALGEFQDAVTSASAVIDGGTHALMTDRFGVVKNQAELTDGYQAYINGGSVPLDVIYDLHRPENITAADNRYVLDAVVDRSIFDEYCVQNAPLWNLLNLVGIRNIRNSTPS